MILRITIILFSFVGIQTYAECQDSQEALNDCRKFIAAHCLDCHDSSNDILNLDDFDFSPQQFSESKFDPTQWEKLLRRVQSRQMPPPDFERPSEDEIVGFTDSVKSLLLKRWKLHPNPGRVGALRRLTRYEYQNTIRDLLGIEIDAEEFLPKDESSHGFDNITVEELSPASLSRYLQAAQKISQLAIGSSGNGPIGLTIRLPADQSQEGHVEGLPFGTRGGTLFDHHFHQSGEYEIELKLTRDRDEKVEGLHRKHDIDILIDKKPIHRFQVTPPPVTETGWEGRDFTKSDAHLKTRVSVQAGKRTVGVTFPKTFSSLVENKRQAF